ncbi:SH3 domain-containing protein [Phormidium pseudopriestleyi FRX01]|uniref:SH3 domain-containing protein n=1 Tax=Phormidium pseudopriestleyi FRX01 TaxID=1759528 RepID=A0ABS3FMT3_9CYAN|nr:SH3 domain-containing protein [Phormidium pseudopriestleyi]MBO0347966.1 SH3 domain-containing protein [Phormidium pseudopriestleyi FRX01]
MRKFTQSHLPAVFVSLLAIAGGLLTGTAQTVAATTPSWQQAQATESFCRRTLTSSGLIIRQGPNTNSPQVGYVPFNEQVTLVQGFQSIQGPQGRQWVEIAAPLRGYVSNGYDNSSNLGYCVEQMGTTPVATTGATPVNLCREVNGDRAPRGLAIRENPSRLSAYKGGVDAGGRVTLVENYQLVRDLNGEPRDWVQITFPINGYISAESLAVCPQG